MKAEFFKPVKPWFETRKWGELVLGADGKSIYSQFGFILHNGIDVALGSDGKVHAPCDGTIVNIQWQPQGGGYFIGFLTDNFYTFPDGISCRVLWDFLHGVQGSCPFQVGDSVKCGDVLMTADNTGFSTGPHTHIQPRRVIWENGSFTTIDKNDAHDSFDPTPYWSGIFAVDYKSMNTLLGQLKAKVVALIQKYT